MSPEPPAPAEGAEEVASQAEAPAAGGGSRAEVAPAPAVPDAALPPAPAPEAAPAPAVPDAALPPAPGPRAPDTLPPGYDPRRMSRTGWVYPLTIWERLSDGLRRVGRAGLVLLGVLALLLAVGLGVPTLAAANSAAYRRACAQAQRDPALRDFALQPPLEPAWAPAWYRIGPDWSEFEFTVEASDGRSARVWARVEGERVALRIREVRF